MKVKRVGRRGTQAYESEVGPQNWSGDAFREEQQKTLEKIPKDSTATVIMPNGNSDMRNVGFYIPLNLEISKGTTVVWLNDDVVGHTIQSQDGEGNVIGLFNSDVLQTGERFPHTFEAEGVYNYFCTIHPWRVGVITVR